MKTINDMRKSVIAFALAALLALLCAPAQAGVESVLARGFKPNIAYQVNEFDSVNTFNGNLLINVPIGPAYKTNGTLSYSFGLRYSPDFWTYISYYGISQGGGGEVDHITIVDIEDGWNTYGTTVIDLGPNSDPGGGGFLGAESIPTGMAGPGWNIATESFFQVVNHEYYRGGVYVDASGASHAFTPNMHATTDCGSQPCTNTVAYTHDGSYLRMRIVNGDVLQREVDLPDGTVKHFRCVADCNDSGALWNLEWTADQFGNVLLIERTLNGAPATGRPTPGQWVWNYTEGTLPDGETRSDPYYHGSAADRAALKVVRQHRLTFSVEDPTGRFHNYPWLLGVRLVRAELAGPHGDRSMLYTFEYQPKQILRPTILPFTLDLSALLIPYNANKSINVNMLQSMTLPENAGKWQFDYYLGTDHDGDGMSYTWCSDYTAPSGGCPAAAKYPTSRLAGKMKSVRAPAGGGYSYEYGLRTFPRRPCFPQPRSAGAYGGGSMVSLKSRQQLDADGNDVPGAVWLYAGHGYLRSFIDANHDGWDDSDVNQNGQWDQGIDTMICRAPVEFLASVLDPNGLLSLNYYNIKFGDEWYGAPYSPEPDRADTMTRRDGSSVTRFLTSEAYEVDNGPNSEFRVDLANAVRRMFPAYRRTDPPTTGTLLRSTYATYDKSAADCDSETLDCQFYNLRMTGQHTRLRDDTATTNVPGPNNTTIPEGAYIETMYGDFDGVGHFRQKNTYGNFRVVGRPNATADEWDHRMEYTLFNPDVSWTQGQANPSGLPSNWLINTFTHQSTMEPGWLVSSRFLYDSTRGFLRAKRSMEANGTDAPIPRPPDSARNLVAQTGPDDFLGVFSRIRETDEDGLPLVISREENYGGDDAHLGGWVVTGDSVEIGSNARRDYTIDTTYRAGAVARTEHRSCDNSQVFLQSSSALVDKGMSLPLATTDESGLTTSYAYDTLGRVINVTPPGGLAAETYSYGAKTGSAGMNRLIVSRTGASTITEIYDGLGRVISESRQLPSGTSTTAYGYTATGKVATQALPIGTPGLVKHQYDVLDREIKTTGADNRVVDTDYISGRGQIITTHNVAAEGGATNALTTKGFDSFGREWVVTDDATKAVYEYDAGSKLIHVILDPVGANQRQHRWFRHDGRGILISSTQPELREAGSDTQVVLRNKVDARGHVFAIDSLWQGAAPRSLDKWRLRFDYDPAERLVEVWQPSGTSGQKTFKSFEYYKSNDAPGRRARLKTTVRHNYFPDPSASGGLPTIDVMTTRAYSTCTGNVTQCTGLLSNVSTTASAPSSNGSPAQAFFSGSVGYQYNALGKISRIDYPTFGPDSPARSITYDYTNEYLTSVREGGARRASISYHLNGLINVVQLAANGVSDTTTADSSGIMRPGKISWKWANGTNDTGTYTYDGAGNISAMGGDTFKYDRALRLTRANIAGQSQGYSYDGFSNMTALAGNALPVDWRSNRLGAPFLYDDAGNIIKMPDRRVLQPAVPNAMITFVFDAVNTMTSIDGQNIGRAFVYDASDERVGVIDYKAAGGRRELWSLRDQQYHVLRDFERTFTATGASVWTWKKDYVHRGAVLSNTIAPVTGVRDIHVDHLGSIRFVTDSNGQLVTGSTTSGTRFWPFGAVVFKRLLDERLAFTGHERDDDGTTSDESDFDDMHARYYSPGIARFLSVDPDCCSVDEPQSWNRYAYVLNNPVNMADPSGRWPQWFDDARTAWTRVTQGVFLHAGATAVQDAAVRQNYLQAAAKLAPTDSAGRTALKVAAREQSSPLGAALAERMRPAAKEAARVGGTASKTNAGVNEGLAAAGRVGKVALVAGVAISVTRVATAEEGERPKVAAEEGGAWAGALAFGAAGAKGGAVVGSFFGPGPGTAIGAAIGGIGGGIFGSFAGAQAADNVYDLFSGD